MTGWDMKFEAVRVRSEWKHMQCLLMTGPSVSFTFLHAFFESFTTAGIWIKHCMTISNAHCKSWLNSLLLTPSLAPLAPGNVPPNSLLPFGTATLGALCDHLAKSHVVKHDNKGTCLCWTWQHSKCSHLFLSFAPISIVTLQLAELHWNSLARYQLSIQSVSVALPLLAWQNQHHIPAGPCPALMLCIVAGPGPGSHNDALQSCYSVKLSCKCNPAWQNGQFFRWWPQSCCTWFQDQVWSVSKQSSSFDTQPSSNTDHSFQSKHLM